MSVSVLIAEDERNIVDSLSFLMTRAGFAVRVAYDGPTALRMVAEDAPQILLLDVMMPGCDGFAVAQSVRQNPLLKEVRILMLTAKGREIDRRKGLALGVDDYITKPFSTRDVVERVKALVAPAFPGAAALAAAASQPGP